MHQTNALAGLIESAESDSFNFLLARGARGALDDLQTLCHLKTEFDQLLTTIGHNISPEVLTVTPVADWCALHDEAQGRWLKSFITKLKVNKAAKRIGYKKFQDLNLLPEIRKAANLQNHILSLAETFAEDNIWQGWQTTSEDLAQANDRCNSIHQNIKQVLSLTDDPADLLTAIKTKLVDGRDFLEGSRLVVQKNEFKQAWGTFSDVAEEADTLELQFSTQDSLDAVNSAIGALTAKSAKFKAWVEWLAQKEAAANVNLEGLIRGLEARTILPEDASDQVRTAFCRWLAPQLIDDSDVLRQFTASSHEQLIEDFEQAVAWALRDKGWKVQTQVGVSKFRVDLGIVHPDSPGVYLAGVECDGATYHGSPSARDRDRVRHSVLENLGWHLIRLWSTDYFQDPEGAIERVDRLLNERL
ncbi:DUF559 domain-containing protein [Endozoicomonas acroporae]|uniref:DUF559 domain-containing protein n=1 Tax=Endozoicomonas acroporae TaxID=1701104 RepID=UPI000C774EDC|nr:DUF559 domain-containing protein [Endozoicomonas acroporae]